MTEELYAFWSYDQYPYVLGGEVVGMDDKGWIQAKGYSSYKFKPHLIVPLERGLDLQAKLDVLRQEKRDEINELHEKYRRRLHAFKNNEKIEL